MPRSWVTACCTTTTVAHGAAGLPQRLAGFDAVRHQYFSDYSLAIAAALQGQGALLGAAAFIQPELRSGRLIQLGRTRVSFGSYWLLESRDRSTATLRAAFCRWIDAEVRKS